MIDGYTNRFCDLLKGSEGSRPPVGSVYVASATGLRIRVYRRDPADGALIFQRDIKLSTGVDNIAGYSFYSGQIYLHSLRGCNTIIWGWQ